MRSGATQAKRSPSSRCDVRWPLSAELRLAGASLSGLAPSPLQRGMLRERSCFSRLGQTSVCEGVAREPFPDTAVSVDQPTQLPPMASTLQSGQAPVAAPRGAYRATTIPNALCAAPCQSRHRSRPPDRVVASWLARSNRMFVHRTAVVGVALNRRARRLFENRLDEFDGSRDRCTQPTAAYAFAAARLSCMAHERSRGLSK